MDSLQLVDGFWIRYLEIGRCAIDADHAEQFSAGDRYTLDGDVRTCLWCGAKHQWTIVPRVVHDETWAVL